MNVGGSGLIAMADLRRAFEATGCTQVATLGASGNVWFRAGGTAAALTLQLEAALAKRMGRETAVMLRTPAQLRALVRKDPFRGREGGDVRLYVSFLDRPLRGKLPDRSAKRELEFLGTASKDVFSIGHPLMGNHGGPNAWLEKQFGVRATTRSWNVVRKLAGDPP